MYQIFLRVVARYAPVITFPVAVVIGFIGYNIEKVFPRERQNVFESIQEKRNKRLLDEATGQNSIQTQFSSQTLNVLDRNKASDLK